MTLVLQVPGTCMLITHAFYSISYTRGNCINGGMVQVLASSVADCLFGSYQRL